MASKANPLRNIAKFSLLIAFLTSTLTLHAKANEGNVLFTGDVLTTDSQLSHGTSSFVMQGDCNLVLYNFGQGSGFQSNTNGRGKDCTLTLNDIGQFVVRSNDNSLIWSSKPTGTQKGKYAAVLRPDGHVAVYGPAIWATAEYHHIKITEGEEIAAELPAEPSVRNVLFSSQVLNNNIGLASRDHRFVVRDDCNLVLQSSGRISWQSNTSGQGKHCFARLGHKGQLVVSDDTFKVVWASQPASSVDGEYVLILDIYGQAVIYGPTVWTTNPLKSDV